MVSRRDCAGFEPYIHAHNINQREYRNNITGFFKTRLLRFHCNGEHVFMLVGSNTRNARHACHVILTPIGRMKSLSTFIDETRMQIWLTKSKRHC